MLDLRGAAPAFPGVWLSGGFPPTAAVRWGSVARRQHLVGTFAWEQRSLPLLLLQLPFQKLLRPARGFLRQLGRVLLLLRPGCEVAVVHGLKVFGDRVFIVTVCPHFLFRPVREVAILEGRGTKHEGGDTLLGDRAEEVGPGKAGHRGLRVGAPGSRPAFATSLTSLWASVFPI